MERGRCRATHVRPVKGRAGEVDWRHESGGTRRLENAVSRGRRDEAMSVLTRVISPGT